MFDKYKCHVHVGLLLYANRYRGRPRLDILHLCRGWSHYQPWSDYHRFRSSADERLQCRIYKNKTYVSILAYKIEHQSLTPARLPHPWSCRSNTVDICHFFSKMVKSGAKHQDRRVFRRRLEGDERTYTDGVYIEHRWIDSYKEKFVGAYITHIKHYGQIFSSEIEGAHAAVRRCWAPLN